MVSFIKSNLTFCNALFSSCPSSWVAGIIYLACNHHHIQFTCHMKCVSDMMNDILFQFIFLNSCFMFFLCKLSWGTGFMFLAFKHHQNICILILRLSNVVLTNWVKDMETSLCLVLCKLFWIPDIFFFRNMFNLTVDRPVPTVLFHFSTILSDPLIIIPCYEARPLLASPTENLTDNYVGLWLLECRLRSLVSFWVFGHVF